MQFYRFWTRAEGHSREMSVTCYGYSNESLEDALRVARERAKKTAVALDTGQLRTDQYYGSDRPFREEIVEEFQDGGEVIAIISRNHYGALVLNVANVFFADVDIPPPEPGLGKILSFFTGKKSQPTFEEQLVQRIDQLCQNDSTLGMRLYRTMAGYRVIITSKTIPAGTVHSIEFLDALGSDPLYAALCRTQDCYRARLTPKPWRCQFRAPPRSFPFENEAEEQAQRAWEREYDQHRAAFATCALIGDFGNPTLSSEVEQIIQLHDHFSLNGQQPLA